jgi:hypothetical protein
MNMKTKLISCFFLFALVLPALGEITIQGETKVPRDKMVKLEALASGKEDLSKFFLIWDVSNEDALDILDLGNKLIFTGPPGKYTLKFRAFPKDGQGNVVTIRKTVEIEGTPDPLPPIPPVPPGPGPVPPDPGPVTAKAWLVIIEETQDALKSRGAFVSDKALKDHFNSKGWKIRIADKDGKDAQGKTPKDIEPYISYVAKKTLPYFFLVGNDGRVYLEGKCPEKASTLLEQLKKIGA